MKKMLICMLLCSLLFGCLSGCGKDKKSSEKKTVERSVEKKSRNSNEEEDKAFFDAVSGIALFKEPLLMATYTGKSEEEIIEVNGKYIRYKYYFELDSVLTHEPSYEIPAKFVLCVGGIRKDEYPVMLEGDRVIVSVRNDETGEAGYAENEFIWSFEPVFFVKTDNTIVSAYKEDSSLDGLTVDILLKKIKEAEAS